MSDGALLKPGVSIRPVIHLPECRGLIKRLYGFEPVDVKQLNGYDDKNFLVEVRDDDGVGVGAVATNGVAAGTYVLKIMNTLDTDRKHFAEGQTEILLYLGDQGTLCPRPLLNVSKKYYSREKLASGGEHVVRLMVFLPGKIFNEIPHPIPQELFYQAGRYIADVDRKLQNFHHPSFDTLNSMWLLDSLPQVRKFLYAVRDADRRALLEKIVEEFEERVLPRRSEFQAGLIHGDFNEQNVLVEEVGDGEWEICGILDFGDAQRTFYLYELAITMTYMMIVGRDLDVGGYVIAGYTSLIEISDLEFSLLKICVMGRLCQSLAMGAYSIQQDPENAYLLATAAPGWDLLHKLVAEPEEELLGKWRDISARME